MSIAGDFPCKICLMDTQLKDMITLQQCGCMFCKEVRLCDLRNLLGVMARFTLISLKVAAHPIKLSVTDRLSLLVSYSLQCLVQYVTYEVMSSAYDISCPDPECEKQGVMHMSEIENLVGKELTDKHKMFRLNTGK